MLTFVIRIEKTYYYEQLSEVTNTKKKHSEI